MSKMPQESIYAVMKAFKEFYDKNLAEGQSFDVKAFMNFMEPKFAAAGYRKKSSPRFMGMRGAEESNILILTNLGVGDFMVSTGVIREIRRVYSEAHITLLSFKKAFGFAEICPYVDEAILYDKFNNTFPKMYELAMEMVDKLLERRFDICFAFPTHPYTDLLMYMSGADFRLTPIFKRNLERMNVIGKKIWAFT